MTCCICIMMDRTPLDDARRECLRQHRRVFPDTPVFVLGPDDAPGLDEYLELLAPAHHRIVPVAAVADNLLGARLRMTPDFYDWFDGYDYVLVSSTETWPVYDALEWWMEQEYDYVAAPWLSLGGAGSEWVRGLDEPRGGRERASLRRVRPVREFVRRVLTSNFNLSKHNMFEDVALSGGLPRATRLLLPKLRYCPRAEQARFAWDRPTDGDEVDGCRIETLNAITRGHLPMLLYAPHASARRLCIPDVPPRTVFVFSSAVRREHDYERLVADAEPDPSKRLLVFANKCRAFRENESGWRLVEKSPRILTVHNECRDAPFGPSWHGEIPLYLAQRGWKGRHDTLTVHWTPWNCANPTVATVDGEIVHTRATRALRAARVVKNPTAGYQTYAILRDRWPDATICLVNFFGNTNGFVVNKCHDVSWEQEAFRRDPKVRMLYCEENQ